MSRADLAAGKVIRLSLLFRLQHMMLMLLLLVLAVTGFALMYHENSLAQWIIRLEGGVHNRGIVHRIAAVLLMANLLYHVFYMLFSREGKPELRQLFIGSLAILFALHVGLELYGRWNRRKGKAPDGREGRS